MGQAAGMDGDVARKAKVYYPIIRKFQNNHMALEKVWNQKNLKSHVMTIPWMDLDLKRLDQIYIF